MPTRAEKFAGLSVAIVTPFRDGAIDWPALDELVERVIDGGVSGLVPCGTTGEAPTLTAEEQRDFRKVMARTAIRRRRLNIAAPPRLADLVEGAAP